MPKVKLIIECGNYRNEEHAFVTVAGVFSCEFLSLEVVPIYACSQDKLETSKNGTTSTEEMSTAKNSNATLHKSMPFISGIFHTLKIQLDFKPVSIYVAVVISQLRSLIYKQQSI